MAKAAKKKVPSKKKSGSGASKKPAKAHAKTKAKPEKKLVAKAKKAAVEIAKKLAAKAVKPSKKAAPEKKPAKSATPAKPIKEAKSASAPAKPVQLGPIVPGRLGQKRGCLKCGVKFYDFERNPITCPKCFSEFDPEDFEPKISLKSDSKKSRPVEKEEEPETEVVVSDSSEFESLEDLNDDDSAMVGIGPDKDSDESFD